MSFRGRLRLFFAIIVIVPMVAVGVVMLIITQRSETGKADAGISKGIDVAFSIYREEVARARPRLRAAASDPRLAQALTAGRQADARKRIRELVRTSSATAIVFESATGSFRAQAGARDAVAFARAPLARRNGQRIGTLLESVTPARAYASRVARLTDLDVVLRRDGSTLTRTLPGSDEVSSGSDTVEIGGRDFRVRASRIPDAPGGAITLAVLDEAAGINDAIGTSRLAVIGIVLAFLLFALAFSLLVVRGLQGQVGQFLEAARRIGEGDFAQRVPITGSDEFADLGREFNSMSEQLESKIEEVEHKRQELEETIRRVGQAFASGLDPQGVVELAVQTAVDACGAEAGRALAGEAFPLRTLRVGSQGPEPGAALEAAEQAARGGYGEATKSEPATVERGGVHALAVPLLARLGTATRVSDVGVISIARRHRAFDHSDEQLLEYLAGQAVVSIENADLHETVQRQAITDELTGLSNVRELQHALHQEIERGRRFDTAVGFVMLDLDDFKQINDDYGHLQGDDVLVAVARVLRSLSRDIDQPARYGGEELAVVLPETELAGAVLLANRMREAIEELRVPVRGSDSVLRVTASFGVASIPACAHDSGTVIEVADAALYRAKRAGKNRVERAEPVRASR